MELQTYLELMQEKLSAYYDTELPFDFDGRTFDLYARTEQRNERYFASKKIKVYAIENKEHVFMKHYDTFTDRDLDGFWQVLIKAADELPEPHDEHMSTIINGIVLTTSTIDAETESRIKKLKHDKSFAFGLKGWVYVRLLVINLNDHTMIHNKRGKEVAEQFGPNVVKHHE
jgi:hypothetical protein